MFLSLKFLLLLFCNLFLFLLYVIFFSLFLLLLLCFTFSNLYKKDMVHFHVFLHSIKCNQLKVLQVPDESHNKDWHRHCCPRKRTDLHWTNPHDDLHDERLDYPSKERLSNRCTTIHYQFR